MFEYDSEKMDTVIENINKIKANLEDDFDNIDNTFQSVSNHWEGEASNAYIKETTRAYYTYPSYIETLEQCVKYIKKSTDSKEEIEKKNNALISGILGIFK